LEWALKFGGCPTLPWMKGKHMLGWQHGVHAWLSGSPFEKEIIHAMSIL